MKTIQLALALTLHALICHAQSAPFSREQQLRNLDAQIAARKAHAAAVHQGQRQAREQDADARCDATFAERLADAKKALTEYGQYTRQCGAAQPKIDWFNAHCRYLSKLEIAIRKLDDENAFVCDKKKPQGLTTELLLQCASAEPTLGSFQDFGSENMMCAARDGAQRVSLFLTGNESKLEAVIAQQQILCYGDERPSCIKARAAIAAVRAKQEDKDHDQTGREDHRATANPNAAARAAQDVR